MLKHASLLCVLLALLTSCNIRTNNATNTPLPTPDAPRIRFLFPENRSTVFEGTDLTIQIAAEDSGSGVARVELLVDDLVYQEAKPEVSAAVPIFTANLNWLAEGVGHHSLAAVAYRVDGVASPPAIIVIEVLKRG